MFFLISWDCLLPQLPHLDPGEKYLLEVKIINHKAFKNRPSKNVKKKNFFLVHSKIYYPIYL